MLDILVVQPTPFCNINCTYCYLTDRSNPAKLSITTADLIIDRLLSDGLVDKQLTIVFHAGEPMVPGVAYYRALLSHISSRLAHSGIQVRYAIQTNGTLINEEWCQLINEYSISIGISIDGPQFLNDMHRLSRKGKSTFADTMRGISYLKEHGVPFHGIAVVSSTSLDHPKALFDFFYENGFYALGLNIEEQEGANHNSSLFDQDSDARIETFFRQMFELFIKSDGHLDVREFSRARGAILRDPSLPDIRLSKINSHQTEPLAIISVDYQGNFSTYSPELIGQPAPAYNNFVLGNVADCSFRKPKNKELFKRIDREIQNGIKRCKKTCSYYHVCGGGAPANKFYENGSFDSTETKYCRYQIQLPLNIVLEHMESQLAL